MRLSTCPVNVKVRFGIGHIIFLCVGVGLGRLFSTPNVKTYTDEYHGLKSFKKGVDGECGLSLVREAREAFLQGKNVVHELHRRHGGLNAHEHTQAIAVAYESQTGAYIESFPSALEVKKCKARELISEFQTFVPFPGPADTQRRSIRVLEVGSGEGTMTELIHKYIRELYPNHMQFQFVGIDVSLSRSRAALSLAQAGNSDTEYVCGDMLALPFRNSSFDIIFTHHAAEPNGGRENDIIDELLRVTKTALLMIEPDYEVAGPKQKARMTKHNYVKELIPAIQRHSSQGVKVRRKEIPMRCQDNRDNRASIFAISKSLHTFPGSNSDSSDPASRLVSPGTSHSLVKLPDGTGYIDDRHGIVFPVIEGVPVLRSRYGIPAVWLAQSLGDRERGSLNIARYWEALKGGN